MICTNLKCQYEWKTRKDNVKECPKCKYYIKYPEVDKNVSA